MIIHAFGSLINKLVEIRRKNKNQTSVLHKLGNLIQTFKPLLNTRDTRTQFNL